MLQEPAYTLDAGEIFTLFFVTLGPLKLLGPFAKLTHALDGPGRRQLAFKSTAIAGVAMLTAGFLGVRLLVKWHVSTDVVLLAAGLVLLLVALRLVLEPYEAPATPVAPEPAPSAFHVAFPGIVTPYGIATVIALLSSSMDPQRTRLIITVLAGVLVLDLLAMLFDAVILKTAGWLLRILGAVLGVLQVALALEIMREAVRRIVFGH